MSAAPYRGLDLPAYRSHKIVRAFKIREVVYTYESIVTTGAMLEPMPEFGLRAWGLTVSVEFCEKHNPQPGGYYVVYEDGYESFSPAKAFEEGYTPVVEPPPPSGPASVGQVQSGIEIDDTLGFSFNFGTALAHLRAGGRAARKGWNGKDMFIYLVQGSHFTVDRPPLNQIYPKGTEITYLPHIDMRTADGACVPWLASQTDILARDWILLPLAAR